MNKEYIQKMFCETLTEGEQRMLGILSVICSEGLSRRVACEVIKSESPVAFDALIDNLYSRNWLFCDHQTVYCDNPIRDAVLEVAQIDAESMIKMLSSLKEYIVLQPLDNMLSRQQHFVAARLLITYLMKIWSLEYCKICAYKDFWEVVIAFAQDVELSYCKGRKPVGCLEDRLDFKLLTFFRQISVPDYYQALASNLLGRLYTKIFRYPEAKICFMEAGEFLDDDPRLLMSQAEMYKNLGLYANAVHYAYRAFLLNKEEMDNDANIEVCLYLAYLCAECDSPASGKHWRKIARSLIGNRRIPEGHVFNITMKEIEALLHIDDNALVSQILDAAELEVCKLYGSDAPEMGRIAYIRSMSDGEAGKNRKSNLEYQGYVEANHFNYGYSVADTACLYSGIISDNVLRGNNTTAGIFAIKMQNLHAEAGTAPSVRISQAFANCASCMSDENYALADAYLDMARHIYEDELRPDETILYEIEPVFQGRIIPKSVSMTDNEKIINQANINIRLGEGRTVEAREMIEFLKENENDGLELVKWDIYLGRVLIKEGKQVEGLDMWRKAIRNAPQTGRFEVAKEIAEWARNYDLIYDTMTFYEDALEADTMVYAKTCDIAESLQCYADVLELCGLKGKSDEPWKQALMLMQSLGDNDGISLLYFSWGAAKQDQVAEELLNKAIGRWDPENYVFDETLSKMYYLLCCVQAMQGKVEGARISAAKAVKLYPADFPESMLENIKLYL